MDKVIITIHIVSMKDEKINLKPNINALIKWWIPLDLLQLHWAIINLGQTCYWYSIGTTKFGCQHVYMSNSKTCWDHVSVVIWRFEEAGEGNNK
jgi:hypothetical protein